MRTAITLCAINHSDTGEDILKKKEKRKKDKLTQCIGESTYLRKILPDLQGPSGQRGPEGSSGKPGDDVSRTFAQQYSI